MLTFLTIQRLKIIDSLYSMVSYFTELTRQLLEAAWVTLGKRLIASIGL